MSLNNVSLVGRITKDLELKYTPSGMAYCKFTLAVNRQFKKDGQPDADFIPVTVFNKQAENLANYMSKGSMIGVTGQIQTGSYEKDGVRVYTTDIIAQSIQFLESKKDSNQQPGQAPQQQQQQPQNNYQQQQYQQQMPPQAPPGYTQQQNFGHQAPQYGQAPQQQQNNDPFAPSNGPINIQDNDLPF